MNRKLDVFEAMLNRHLNNAGHLAKLIFIQLYGEQMWFEQMLYHERSNMVRIFQANANEYNTFYVLTVMAIVNSNRS